MDITSDGVRGYQRWTAENPVDWMRETLGVTLWSRQAEIALAVRDHSRVAVKSSNAIGKSFLAACLTAWYLQCHSPGYVVTTSSSHKSLEWVLWPEIRHIVRGARFPLGGELLQMTWKLGNQWGAFGVSADVAENFAGFRTAGGTFVIVDEASAIEPGIFDAIMGLLASAGSKVLMIGNPLRPEGPFYEAFRSAAWKTFHISALECPNVVKGENIIPGLATREWVEERKAEWGEDSPAYQARVLGEFPEAGEDLLIPPSWTEAAMARQAPDMDRASLRMGVDVAREGGDRIVFVIRDSRAIRHVETHRHESLMSTAGRVQHLADEWGVKPERVYLDDCGLGGGVTDRLRELDFAVRAVNFGSKAHDSTRFANMRAEAYWNLRIALDPRRNSAALAIPRIHANLAHECAIARREFTSIGQIKLEPKDRIKARLGRSPDLADSLAMTYVGDAGVEIFIPQTGIEHIKKGREVNPDDSRMAMVEADDAWR